jgi:hypothetical protein
MGHGTWLYDIDDEANFKFNKTDNEVPEIKVSLLALLLNHRHSRFERYKPTYI